MANVPLNTLAIDEKDLPKEWYEISTAYGIVMIARCWIPVLFLALACGVLTYPLTWIFAVFFIGVFQYHMNILGHSGQHWQLAKNRKINDVLTRWFLQGPLVLPLKRMRRTHLAHHNELDTNHDEDRWYYDLALTGRLTPKDFNLWLISLFCGGTLFNHVRRVYYKLAGRSVLEDKGAEKIEVPANLGKPTFDSSEKTAIVVSHLVLVVLFWALTGQVWAYAVLWLVPRFTVMTGLNGIRASIEHADLHHPPQRLKSFSSNPVERFFLAPFYMNYHGEHHACMAVPAQNLPRLRKLFVESEHGRDFEIVSSYWAEYKRILKDMRQNNLVAITAS